MHLLSFLIIFTTTAPLLPTFPIMILLLDSLLPLVLIYNLSSAPSLLGPSDWSIPVPHQKDQAKEQQEENHSYQDHNNDGPRGE